uniref:hypothetical protein n=1 Tax=Hafnia alvei TaxID=569 RepID=UPI00242D31B9|nr:hypothetical protein [Hafnia alvei]
MTKLTKEQIKFFIETMTDDMHNTTQHEIAETLLSKFDECESLQATLLAYEQASKNPVAWIVHMRTGDQFTTDSDFVGLGESTHGIHSTPLYAAPVLPKHPESESIICWSCKKTITLTQHAEADGFCPLCDAEIELEPAQPVIPEQPEPVVLYMGRELISKEGLELIRDGISEATKLESACLANTILGGSYRVQPVMPRELRSFVTDADIAALHRFAECCDDPESGGHDLEKEQVQLLEKIGALQRSGRISYITDFGDYLISANAPINAQPVSEPKAEGDVLSRLKAEHVELEDRYIKLANFIQVNPEF